MQGRLTRKHVSGANLNLESRVLTQVDCDCGGMPVVALMSEQRPLRLLHAALVSDVSAIQHVHLQARGLKTTGDEVGD